MFYTKLSNILNDVNSLLFPRLCFGCNVRLYRGEQVLCTFCRNQLPLTEYSFNEENAVDRIFYGRTDIKKASSFLYYNDHGIVKNIIHQLKYRKQEQLGEFLGNWYGQMITESSELSDVDTVIPVPLHPKKLRKRGYNQVDLFGKSLAGHLSANYVHDALIKTENTKTQTRKQRSNRLKRDDILYRLKDPMLLKNKHVLLVDDVITTGATMEACANALLEAPEVVIYVASMAVVP